MRSHTRCYRHYHDKGESRQLAFAEFRQINEGQLQQMKGLLKPEESQKDALAKQESEDERLSQLVQSTNRAFSQSHARDLPDEVADRIQEQTIQFLENSAHSAEVNGIAGLNAGEFENMVQQVEQSVKELCNSITGGEGEGRNKAEQERQESERKARSVETILSQLRGRAVEHIGSGRVDRAALEDTEHPERVQAEIKKYQDRQQHLQEVQGEIVKLGTDIQDFHDKAGKAVKELMDPPVSAAAAAAATGAATGAAIGVWFFGVGAAVGASIGAVIGYAGARLTAHLAMSSQGHAKAAEYERVIFDAKVRFVVGQKSAWDAAHGMEEDGKILGIAPGAIQKKQYELYETRTKEINARRSETAGEREERAKRATEMGISRKGLESHVKLLEERRDTLEKHHAEVQSGEHGLGVQRTELLQGTFRINEAIDSIEAALPQLPPNHPQLQDLTKQLTELREARMKGQTGLQDIFTGQLQLNETRQETQEQLNDTVAHETDLKNHQQSLENTIELLRASIPVLAVHEADLGKTAEQMQSELKVQLATMSQMGGQIGKEVLRANALNTKGVVGISASRRRLDSLPPVEAPNIAESVMQGTFEGIGHALKFVITDTIGGALDGASQFLKDLTRNIPGLNEAMHVILFPLDVTSGLVHGVGELCEGVCTLLAHPIATVEGLGALISRDPKTGEWGHWDKAGEALTEMGKALISWKEFSEGEVGKGLGKIALNVIMTATGMEAVGAGATAAKAAYLAARAGGSGTAKATLRASVAGIKAAGMAFGGNALEDVTKIYQIARLEGQSAGRAALRAGLAGGETLIRDTATNVYHLGEGIVKLPGNVIAGAGHLLAAPRMIYQHLRMPKIARLTESVASQEKGLAAVMKQIQECKIGGKAVSEIPQFAGKTVDEIAAMTGTELIAAGMTDVRALRQLREYRKLMSQAEGMEAALAGTQHKLAEQMAANQNQATAAAPPTTKPAPAPAPKPALAPTPAPFNSPIPLPRHVNPARQGTFTKGEEAIIMRNDGSILRGHVGFNSQDGWHVLSKNGLIKPFNGKNPKDIWRAKDFERLTLEDVSNLPEYSRIRARIRAREFVEKNRMFSEQAFDKIFPKNAVLKQQNVRNCSVVSSLEALRRNHHFHDLIVTSFTEVREGNKIVGWNVRVPFGNKNGQIVHITLQDIRQTGRSILPVNAPHGYRVLEAVVAKFELAKKPRIPRRTGGNNLNIGESLNGVAGDTALGYLMGEGVEMRGAYSGQPGQSFAKRGPVIRDQVFSYFESFSNEKDMGVFGTWGQPGGGDKKKFLIPGIDYEFYHNHAYAIQSVDRFKRTVTITNPHNTAKSITLTWEQSLEAFRRIRGVEIDPLKIFSETAATRPLKPKVKTPNAAAPAKLEQIPVAKTVQEMHAADLAKLDRQLEGLGAAARNRDPAKLNEIMDAVNRKMSGRTLPPEHRFKVLDATHEGRLVVFDGDGLVRIVPPDDIDAFLKKAREFSKKKHGRPIVDMANFADEARLQVAENIVNQTRQKAGLPPQKLTQTQRDAIVQAHYRPLGSETGAYRRDLRARGEDLKKAGFSKAEIDEIMRAGVTGWMGDILDAIRGRTTSKLMPASQAAPSAAIPLPNRLSFTNIEYLMDSDGKALFWMTDTRAPNLHYRETAPGILKRLGVQEGSELSFMRTNGKIETRKVINIDAATGEVTVAFPDGQRRYRVDDMVRRMREAEAAPAMRPLPGEKVAEQAMILHDVGIELPRNFQDIAEWRARWEAVSFDKKQPPLTRELLSEQPLRPTSGVTVDGKRFYVSDIIAGPNSRLEVVMYVEHEGVIVPRVFYKSHSNGGWRATPFSTQTYSKGKDIHYVQETQPVQELITVFDRMERERRIIPYHQDIAQQRFNLGDLIGPNEKTYTYMNEVSKFNDGGVLAGVQKYPPGRRWTFARPTDGETAAMIRSSETLPAGFVPDFSSAPVSTYQKTHPILGKVTVETYDGTLAGRPVRWHMAHDGAGRVWIDRIHLRDARVNSYGTYNEVIDSGLLTNKPIEYSSQSGFAGERAIRLTDPQFSQYSDITHFLDQLAPIRQFRARRGIVRKAGQAA